MLRGLIMTWKSIKWKYWTSATGHWRFSAVCEDPWGPVCGADSNVWHSRGHTGLGGWAVLSGEGVPISLAIDRVVISVTSNLWGLFC